MMAAATDPAEHAAASALERRLPLGLAGVLLLATLGQGGNHPASMLAWHGALLALLVAWLVGSRGAAGSPGRLAPGPLAAGALFLLLVATGVARAPYAYGALLVSLELACALGIGWLASAAGAAGLRLLALPLGLGAALHGLWAIAQQAAGGPGRPASTFLNSNHLALWLVAVSLLQLDAPRAAGSRFDLVRRTALLAPAAVTVVLTGSRGAAIALAAGAAWLLWVRWRQMSPRWRSALPAVVLALLALLAWRQLGRIEQHDPYRHHRLKIWAASLTLLASDPWWGSGPGQFAAAKENLRFADGVGPLRFDRQFEATHSDLVRLPVEFGIPAALAALTALGLTLRHLSRGRRGGRLPAGADGACAALIAIAAHATVDNPSQWPAVYLLASVLVGSLVASPPADRRPLVTAGRGRRSLLAAMLAGAFVVADVGPFLAWLDLARLPAGSLRSASDRQRLERTLMLNPLHPEARLRLAEATLQDADGWGIEAYATAREAAEHAVRLHPGAARYRRGLAQVEAQGCRTLFRDAACRERVAAAYAAAELRARHDPFLPLALAAFLIDTGDPAGARRAAERALALEPEAVSPRLLLADAFLSRGSKGDLPRALELVAEARARAQAWAGSDFEDEPYARRLLQPEPRFFERLEGRLAAAGASPHAERLAP